VGLRLAIDAGEALLVCSKLGLLLRIAPALLGGELQLRGFVSKCLHHLGGSRDVVGAEAPTHAPPVRARRTVAAVIDPFSWMPPVGEIWADCEDNYATAVDECELADRYPGFWGHAVINFAYAVASAAALFSLARGVIELREARAERFSGDAAMELYLTARQRFALACSLSAAIAAVPILAALL
jgi:hypothetical protein